MKHGVKISGQFNVELIGKDDSIIREATIPNGITYEGKNLMLDNLFNGATQSSLWYIGLIDTVSFSGVSFSDTMISHPGWIEFTGYVEATRQAWPKAAASNAQIFNPITDYAEIEIVGAQVLKGLFIVSDDIIGATDGDLWSTALFADSNIGSDWSIEDGQILRIQYGVVVS